MRRGRESFAAGDVVADVEVEADVGAEFQYRVGLVHGR